VILDGARACNITPYRFLSRYCRSRGTGQAALSKASLTYAPACPQADNNVCVLGQHNSLPVKEVAADPYISLWSTPET